MKRDPGRTERGQGLVAYALILVLVALAVIVALRLTGRAVQRNYGVIAGALGVTHNTSGQQIIEIMNAQCIALESAQLTGLWVLGNTNEDVADLTASTEQAVGTGMDGLNSPVESNGANGFKFHPLLAYKADLSVCPQAVVIQARDGAIAVAPITKVMKP
jgi:Flp pilus assembly pilin Flp